MSDNFNTAVGPFGKLTVETVDKDGMILTKEHGFTVQEDAGKVLHFDKIENPEYGNILLFGDQIYFLKFWDTSDLKKAIKLTQELFLDELKRRGEDV